MIKVIEEKPGVYIYEGNREYIEGKKGYSCSANKKMEETLKNFKQAKRKVAWTKTKKYVGIISGLGLVGYGLWRIFKK